MYGCAPSGVAVADDVVDALANDLALSVNNNGAEAATCEVVGVGFPGPSL